MSEEPKDREIDQPRDAPAVSRRRLLGGAVAGGVGGVLSAPLRTWGAGATPQPSPTGAGMNPRLFVFLGGDEGSWAIVDSKTIVGEALPVATRLNVDSGPVPGLPAGAKWRLRGVTSNERYVTRLEKDQLLAKQAGLGRPEATCAALIPIRKNAKWWSLTQDERRQIFEERSHHTRTGLKYLPAVARRLHHCRDLAESEPFDFLTWFEFAKADSAAFDRLLAELRASEEWTFVDREVEIRVARDGA